MGRKVVLLHLSVIGVCLSPITACMSVCVFACTHCATSNDELPL